MDIVALLFYNASLSLMANSHLEKAGLILNVKCATFIILFNNSLWPGIVKDCTDLVVMLCADTYFYLPKL